MEALQTILDEGEPEVIAIGQEIKANLLLLDNREPRLFAKSVDLLVIGTVGIIKLAWQRGFIKKPSEETGTILTGTTTMSICHRELT